jgi:hypothetical protein
MKLIKKNFTKGSKAKINLKFAKINLKFEMRKKKKKRKA